MPRKYTLDLNNIKTDSHAKYYWLGFIAGDGSIARNEARLRIELKHDDIEHLNKFNRFMGSDTPITTRTNNSGCECSCCSINSAELKRYLVQYNLVPAKTFTFTIPEDKIPLKYMNDFLRGLLDSDGNITIRGEERKFSPLVQFTTCNQTTAEQIKRLLNIDTQIKDTHKNAWMVCKEGKEVPAILDKLYQTSTPETRLDRKYELYKQVLNTVKY